MKCWPGNYRKFALRPRQLDDPAAYFAERAKVGLSPGPSFGELGMKCARLNFGTTPQILDEIVNRLAMSINGASN